jgi:hypothetical protein
MRVATKASSHPMATILIRVLLVKIRPEYSCDGVRNSEVIISIIAVIASHKLISESVNGIFMSSQLPFSIRPRLK